MTADHDTEMACKELVEVVTDYLEGAISDAERREALLSAFRQLHV